MIPEEPNLRLVGRFWAAYQARNWALAQALLAPGVQCRWWATSELFDGAPATVGVNAAYPEGWRIHLLELQGLSDGRVLSMVRVDHGALQFWANSFFTLGSGLITALDEYWSDAAEPPSWRQSLPDRHIQPADARAGMPLDPALWD